MKLEHLKEQLRHISDCARVVIECDGDEFNEWDCFSANNSVEVRLILPESDKADTISQLEEEAGDVEDKLSKVKDYAVELEEIISKAFDKTGKYPLSELRLKSILSELKSL